jgi:hypothetical protein
MVIRLEEDHPSIVVIGGFDPRRFQPHWFRTQKLLGEAEAERAEAEVRVIHDQITEWSTEWFNLQVTVGRFFAVAKVESRAESLRDFVLGTLQLLEHTVTTALGLNRSMHFDVGGEDNWHRVGDSLAPKALWSPHMRRRAGLRTLQIEETTRSDDLPGKTFVTVQPSLAYKHGVFFDVNNEIHPRGESTPFFAEVIRDNWQRLQDDARATAEDVLQKALQ